MRSGVLGRPVFPGSWCDELLNPRVNRLEEESNLLREEMRDFVSIYTRDICDVFAKVRKRSRERKRETNTNRIPEFG